MHNTEKIKYLFNRYVSQSATPEEEAELAKLILETDQDTLSALLENALEDLDTTDPVISPQRAEIILQQIIAEKEEDTEEVKEPVVVIPERKRKWQPYALASVVVLIIAGVYFFDFNKKDKQETVTIKKQGDDLSPGHNGAILTLGNGEKILLDSAGNGLLATQGSIHVINNKGQLSYQSEKENNDAVMYNTMTTPKGRQYQLELADGSKVWLNAASSITYPTVFTGNERKVSINGEAYFEISPDKTKPFKVTIDGKGEVEVLGTHFNINAYADEPTVNTTLLEGSVKIRSFGNNANTAKEQAILRPGQQARLNAGLEVVDDVNTGEVMAWKNGYFSFNGATTEAIMRQVKRWYDAEILYEGTVKEERFAGSVPRSANASKLLEVLELTKTVKFVIEDKKIIVKPYQ